MRHSLSIAMTIFGLAALFVFMPVRALAADTGTLSCGSWTLNYTQLRDDSIQITGVVDGSGDLNLDNITNHVVTEIAQGVFRDNKSLTSVNISKDVKSLGCNCFYDTIYAAETDTLTMKTPFVISSGTSFNVNVSVANNHDQFNKWGCALIATGKDPIAVSYDNGFQLYLKNDSMFILKTGPNETVFSLDPGDSFRAEVDYDAILKTLSVGLVNNEGQRETHVIDSYTVDSVYYFTGALPYGMSETVEIFNPLPSNVPFMGCTALTRVTVDQDNRYLSSNNGILYNKIGDVMLAYPESRLFTGAFRLYQAKNKSYLFSDPLADASGVIIDNQRNVGCQTTPGFGASLWRFNDLDNGYVRVEHLNSQRYMGQFSSSRMVEIPTSVSQWYGEYTYNLSYNGPKCQVSLKTSDGYYVTYGYNTCTFQSFTGSEAANTFIVVPFDTLTVNETMVMTLPVNVKVIPQGNATAYAALSESDGYLYLGILSGWTVNAGTAIIAKPGALLLYTAEQGTKVLPSNLLTGTLLSRTGMTSGSFYLPQTPTDNVFLVSDGTTTPANSAFFTTDDLANVDGSTNLDTIQIFGGKTTGVEDISVDDEQSDETLYDLSGRKVYGDHPSPGVYINSAHKKEVIVD